jgi:hypothetical protein
LVLLALAATTSCAGTRRCKDGTLLLTVTFDGTTVAATKLAISIGIDSGTPTTSTVDHDPKEASGKIEVDFPHNYPRGTIVSIHIEALRNGLSVGAGDESLRLNDACASLSIAIGAGASDGGADVRDSSPPDGVSQPGTGGRTGSGGQTGAGGGMSGTGGIAGTGGITGRGGSAGTGGVPGPNLVTNGDFSDGDIHWVFKVLAGTNTIPHGVKDGAYCVTITAAQQAILGWPGSSSATAQLQGGRSYTFSYSISSSNIPAISVEAKVAHFVDPYTPDFLQVDQAASGLQTVTHVFTPTATDGVAGIGFTIPDHTLSFSGTTEVCIDDVSLRAGP